MLHAMLHGKLSRAEEGMEDLLTANVFGILRYAPPASAVLPWFALASNPLTGVRLSDWLPGGTIVEQIEFWPTLAAHGCTPCEPDVSLMLRHADSTRTWLAVEAKYRSGKSSFADDGETPPQDQLAREYDNLAHLAPARSANRFAVIFLTTDITCPVEEIRASADELSAKRAFTPDLFWLSWRTLPDILVAASAEHPMLADLRALLLQMDLTMYRRLRPPIPIPRIWRFQRPHRSWRWHATRTSWRFAGAARQKPVEAIPTAPVAFTLSLDINAQQHFRWRRS